MILALGRLRQGSELEASLGPVSTKKLLPGYYRLILITLEIRVQNIIKTISISC
jgi:hypothetical protein